MATDDTSGTLNSCGAVCWILAVAAGLFVAAVCVYWAGIHGLLSAVLGLIALLGAGYLLPLVFCTGRGVVPVAPEAPMPAATTAAPVIPEAAPAPAPKKAAGAPKLYDTAPKAVDDLKAIAGVGPALEKKLNDLGVYKYDQVAAWTKADVAWVDDRLKFRGRIARDGWVKQAKKLAKG